jgi:hypothetical protein
MSSSMMLSPVFGNSFNLSIYFMKSESSWGWTARHRLPGVGLMSMSMRALDISTKDILAMALGKVGRDWLWKLGMENWSWAPFIHYRWWWFPLQDKSLNQTVCGHAGRF